MLAETFEREGDTGVQLHSRQSILMRLITHEAYHAGEISLALGANRREPIDLWPPEEWAVGPAGGRLKAAAPRLTFGLQGPVGTVPSALPARGC